jgi:hypothetical protein
MSDLVEVVLDAVEGRLLEKSEFDLLEHQAHTLRELVESLRDWLGIAPARMRFAVPELLAHLLARVADALGYLGWRSPIRTTTLRVLAENVVGDSQEFRAVSDRKISSLRQTLASMPSTLQARWFARLYLLIPLLVAVLSVFWLLSGIISLSDVESAAALTGLTPDLGRPAVLIGAAVDVGLGVGILYQPAARGVCWGMVLVGLNYLVLGSLLRPDLWADPLGPLLKILPVTALTLVTIVLLDDRR